MSRRKVHLEKAVWEYTVGSNYVSIWSPSGNKITVLCSTIKNSTPDDFDRGQWEKTSDGMITPQEVKTYIENLKSW